MPVIEIRPEITEYDLLRMLGGPKRVIPAAIMPSVEKWRAEALELVDPSAAYCSHRIESVEKGIVKIAGGPEFMSKSIAAGLRKCEEVICFIATIGSRIEEEMIRLNSDGNLSDSYILDAIGSAAVENMCLQLALQFETRLAEEGRSLTWHFSPGTCDWDVAEQKKLFPLIDHEKIGVRLTDSCLMTPKKSVSGIVGILPHPPESSVADRNPCKRCNKTDCFARRT